MARLSKSDSFGKGYECCVKNSGQNIVYPYEPVNYAPLARVDQAVKVRGSGQ